MIAAQPSSTSINVEHYLLSFRVTGIYYKWSYLELCITFLFLIKSKSVRIHKQHLQTKGRTAQPSHLPCPMAHSEQIFLWFICATTLGLHFGYEQHHSIVYPAFLLIDLYWG